MARQGLLLTSLPVKDRERVREIKREIADRVRDVLLRRSFIPLSATAADRGKEPGDGSRHGWAPLRGPPPGGT